MVKNLLHKDKRGVSLMIGYVLLIVTAIGISIGVFAYLKLYLPKDQPECYDDVKLSIDDVVCSGQQIQVTLTNRGLFTLDGVQIRIGDANRIFKNTLNKEPYIFYRPLDVSNTKLKPQETWTSVNYGYSYDPAGELKELEIEPFLYFDNKAVLCEKAVVALNVYCSG